MPFSETKGEAYFYNFSPHGKYFSMYDQEMKEPRVLARVSFR